MSPVAANADAVSMDTTGVNKCYIDQGGINAENNGATCLRKRKRSSQHTRHLYGKTAKVFFLWSAQATQPLDAAT